MSMNVLLVDDDVNVLRGLGRVLHRQPYNLYTARSGEEAIAILKSRPIDVLVTDEQMPGLSGGDLIAWMARHAPDVMRIVLTGHATVDRVIRAVNEGSVYQYFTKPCNDLDLAVAIRKAIELRQLQCHGQELSERAEVGRRCDKLVDQHFEEIRQLVEGPLDDHLSRLARQLVGNRSGSAHHDAPNGQTTCQQACDVVVQLKRLLAEIRDGTRCAVEDSP